jgi:hypothetical protein
MFTSLSYLYCSLHAEYIEEKMEIPMLSMLRNT